MLMNQEYQVLVVLDLLVTQMNKFASRKLKPYGINSLATSSTYLSDVSLFPWTIKKISSLSFVTYYLRGVGEII